MASIDELQQQLEIASALNSAVSDGNKLLEQRSRLMSNQADLAREMQGSLERMTGTASDRLSRLEDQLRRTTEAMSESAEETNDLTSEIDRLSDQVDKTSEGFSGLKTSGLAITGALAGLRAGFLKTLNQLSLFGGLVTNVAKGMFNLGFAIVSLPFRLLSGLVRFAGSGGGGLELLQAYEKVREVFGDLASNEGAALIESFQNLRSQAGNLGGTGISLSRVFGVGPGGLAAALGALQEVATSLGARFSVLQNDFLEAGGEILALQRGLGLTADQMAALGTRAIVDGQSFNDVLTETASLSIQLGDQFGISSKLVSRDIATMAADFENFGSLSQEELATTAVFARKLGIEVSDLQGVIGAFDEFESAAENASRLAQAFGLNVDAIQLLNAENPAERIDMLRDSFFAAGRSIESLTRQERALLAQTTGLSGAALEAAFAQENMGLSYDTISQAAEDAAESPMSTEEAMVRLADSIERVFESGGGMDSFFGAFAEGFQQGLRWGGPFRELIMAIRQSLIATRQAGREFARMFVSNFPGLLEIVEALTDAFDPEKFRGFFRDVTAAFQTFFNTLNPENSASATSQFLDGLQNAFTTNFGDGAGSILMRIRDGFIQMGNFVLNAITGLLPSVIDGLAALFNSVADFLARNNDGERKLTEGFELTFEGPFSDALNSLVQVLIDRGPALLAAFGRMFEELKDELEPFIAPIARTIGVLFLTNMFSTAVIGAAFTAISGNIANLFGSMLGLIKGSEAGILARTRGLFTGIGSRIAAASPRLAAVAGRALSFLNPVFWVAAAASVGSSVNQFTESIGDDLENDFGELGSKMGILGASVIDTLTLGLLPDSFIESTARFIANIGGQFQGLLERMGLNFLLDGIMRFYDGATNILGGLADFFGGVFSGDMKRAGEGIGRIFAGVGQTIIASFQNALAFVTELPFRMLQLGGEMAAGFIDGLVNFDYIGALRDFGGGVMDGLRGVFDIRSPSRLTMEIGEQAAAGVSVGLSQQEDSVVAQAESLAQRLTNGLTGALGTGAIDIDAKLGQIAEGLGIDNGTLTVRQEAMNVTINLNVTMDADDVRAAITGNRSATIATT